MVNTFAGIRISFRPGYCNTASAVSWKDPYLSQILIWESVKGLTLMDY